jgi:putative peptidoglycan lipid II flippase
VKIAIFTLISTQLMNLIFVFGLDLKHAGLALSIGLGACMNAGALYYHLRKANIYQPQAGWVIFISKLVAAVLLMALVLYYVAGSHQTWLGYTLVPKLMHLLLLLVVGSATYFVALYLMGIRIKDFMRRTKI